jgi:hypothetical protein
MTIMSHLLERKRVHRGKVFDFTLPKVRDAEYSR